MRLDSKAILNLQNRSIIARSTNYSCVDSSSFGDKDLKQQIEEIESDRPLYQFYPLISYSNWLRSIGSDLSHVPSFRRSVIPSIRSVYDDEVGIGNTPDITVKKAPMKLSIVNRALNSTNVASKPSIKIKPK